MKTFLKNYLPLALGLCLAAPPLSAGPHDGHGDKTSKPKGVAGIDVWAEGGTVHLLAGRHQAGGAPALEYSRSEDGGATWTPPAPLGKGLPAPYRAEAGDLRVAAGNGVIMAVWSAAGPGPMKSGPLVAAVSRDKGQSWQLAGNPSADSNGHGRRFPALAVDKKGVFHLAWLDRKTNSQVRYARSADAGRTWSPEATVDDDACECCWNQIATGGEDDVTILYRDKDPRDMAVAVSKDGGMKWTSERRAGDFKWDINACPHTGGGLVHAGQNVVATVWTGDDEKMGLYCTMSGDGAETWTPPAPVGSPAAKFSDMAGAGDLLAAVWEETSAKGQGVFAARSSDGGKTWSAPAALKETQLAGGPRVVSVGGGYRAFWVEKSADGNRAWKSAAF